MCIKGSVFIVCLTIVTLISIATFRPHICRSSSGDDENLQCASKRRDQYQSDNRETNDKTKLFNIWLV